MEQQCRKDLWESDIPYDETAEEWLIDGKYHAFVIYSTNGLKEGSPADTSGNVITLHPDAHPDTRPNESKDVDAIEFLKEHEAQHVIQYFEIENSDEKYKKNPLKYEKEACARQIIKGTVKTDDLRRSLICHLKQLGMAERQAKSWIEGVFKSMSYPGVTDPR